MADDDSPKKGVPLAGKSDYDHDLYGGVGASYDATIAVGDDENYGDERERLVAK
jgi:hypothetical protein